jgi:RES domain-containing protein
MDFEFLATDYSYLEAEVPSQLISTLKKPETISGQWRANPPISLTQDYGSNWIQKCKTLGLAVPSAVLPNENNILINPKHLKISELKVIKKGKLDLDSGVF